MNGPIYTANLTLHCGYSVISRSSMGSDKTMPMW